MIVKSKINSDWVGAVSSGLCMIHCLATPLLFILQSCSDKDCRSASPLWWSAIDYAFIIITLFAVYYSSKNTSKVWMKYSLPITWLLLCSIVLNEKVGLIAISAWWKHLAAITMISVHMVNLKFCQCSIESCCTTLDVNEDYKCT